MTVQVAKDGTIFVITIGDGGLPHRRPIVPGHFESGKWVDTDITMEPEEIQEACLAAWTPDVVRSCMIANPWIDPDPREMRDRLLKESDWTQLPDAPVDQARWAIYRQALRDLDMTNPDWPEKPEGDVSEDEKLRVERVLDRAARTILFDGKNKA